MKSWTICMFCVALAACQSHHAINTDGVGLYQFEGKAVWVRIAEHGLAYQCRIGSAAVYSATGRITFPDRVEWSNDWGTELLVIDDEGITLSGEMTTARGVKSHESRFHRTTSAVAPECQSALFPKAGAD